MKQKKWQVMVLAVLLLITMLASPITAAPGQGVERADYLVGFHGSPNRGLVERFGGEVYAEFDYVKAVAVRLPAQAAEALKKNPMIAYVEPDAEVYALEQDVPWGIDRVFGDESYEFATWSTSRGSGIGVAVLDTGIDGTHEDLYSNVKDGYNVFDDTVNYYDGHGHGTHVAGTIAALDNTLGVVGVAPRANLYGVKVLSDEGSGSTSGIIEGIEWAITNKENIQIINMSLGSGTYSETFEAACKKAFDEGILVISSAGNSGNPAGKGDSVGYPAKYDSVIAVAASDNNDKRASFSSTGPAVELIAPGVSVLSTVPNYGYSSYSGTSMASPHVAGVAALVWAANPDLTNTEVRSILRENTENLGLDFNHQGYGLVRADLAVAAAGGIQPPEVKYYTITATAGEGGSISPSGEVAVEEGNDQTFTISPDEGYEIDDVKVDDASIGKVTTYTFNNVTADHTIEAFFVKTTEDPPNPPDGLTKLDVSIVEPLDASSYKYNAWVNIRVSTTDQNGQAVADATVEVTIEDPKGSGIATYTGNTGTDGIFTTSHRVANKSTQGTYTILATAFKGTVESTEAAKVTFNVTGR